MVLVGKSGLYHFLGRIIEVPWNGEVEVTEKPLIEAMKAAGFTVAKAKKGGDDNAGSSD